MERIRKGNARNGEKGYEKKRWKGGYQRSREIKKQLAEEKGGQKKEKKKKRRRGEGRVEEREKNVRDRRVSVA